MCAELAADPSHSLPLGTRDRVRVATVCRNWASVLARPAFWREVQLDAADFRAAGGPRALATALLALAGRADGGLDRVSLVSASGRASGDGGGAAGALAPPPPPAASPDPALDAAASPSRPRTRSTLLYGDGVTLEPFAGAASALRGAPRELERALAAAWAQRPPPPAAAATAVARIEAALAGKPFGRRPKSGGAVRGAAAAALRAAGGGAAETLLALASAALAARLLLTLLPLLAAVAA